MNQEKKIKIVFFGTPEIAVPALEKLHALFEISAVVTQPDKPAGRKKIITAPPVKTTAQKIGCMIFQPEKIFSIIENLKTLKADIGILFAYEKIIPKKLISVFPCGIINLHPSLLPKYRGASPAQTAILNSEKYAGVSIILLDEKIDHGPVVLQEKIAILPDENSKELLKRLSEKGIALLPKAIYGLIQKTIVPVPQNDADATYTHKFTKENGLIDTNNSTQRIYSQFKALYPWPGIYCTIGGKRLKILDLRVSGGNTNDNLPSGTIFITDNGNLAIKCNIGAIELYSMQFEGKKPISGEQFMRGYKNYIGKRANA